MGDELQARQAQKSAGSLDRVDQAEDTIKGTTIGRISFKNNKLGIDSF